MDIYFAHAIADYDTEYENKCIELIRSIYPDCVIHNPKDLNKTISKDISERRKFNMFFFPEIDKCDIVVAALVFNHNKRGEILSGTQKELDYAKKKNKPRYIIDGD